MGISIPLGTMERVAAAVKATGEPSLLRRSAWGISRRTRPAVLAALDDEGKLRPGSSLRPKY